MSKILFQVSEGFQDGKGLSVLRTIMGEFDGLLKPGNLNRADIVSFEEMTDLHFDQIAAKGYDPALIRMAVFASLMHYKGNEVYFLESNEPVTNVFDRFDGAFIDNRNKAVFSAYLNERRNRGEARLFDGAYALLLYPVILDPGPAEWGLYDIKALDLTDSYCKVNYFKNIVDAQRLRITPVPGTETPQPLLQKKKESIFKFATDILTGGFDTMKNMLSFGAASRVCELENPSLMPPGCEVLYPDRRDTLYRLVQNVTVRSLTSPSGIQTLPLPTSVKKGLEEEKRRQTGTRQIK